MISRYWVGIETYKMHLTGLLVRQFEEFEEFERFEVEIKNNMERGDFDV
tara:strand:- start:347 stop:493 length:147 start_codon:yes stop_codon:yes gene_type:complete